MFNVQGKPPLFQSQFGYQWHAKSLTSLKTGRFKLRVVPFESRWVSCPGSSMLSAAIQPGHLTFGIRMYTFPILESDFHVHSRVAALLCSACWTEQSESYRPSILGMRFWELRLNHARLHLKGLCHSSRRAFLPLLDVGEEASTQIFYPFPYVIRRNTTYITFILNQPLLLLPPRHTTNCGLYEAKSRYSHVTSTHFFGSCFGSSESMDLSPGFISLQSTCSFSQLALSSAA